MIKSQILASNICQNPPNCPTWQDYLKSLLPLTTPAIKSEREAHTDIVVKPGEKFEQGCAFIEKLMIQENDELVLVCAFFLVVPSEIEPAIA